MSKKILKFSSSEIGLNPVDPAKKHIPDWYKNTKGDNKKNIVFDERNVPLLSFKSCIPFLDSLSSGYIVTLHCDLHFEPTGDDSHYIRWGVAEPIPIEVGDNDNQNSSLPIPHGFSSKHYAWKVPYVMETPPGYSILISHPLNRFDLPFMTLSAIIDSDSIWNSGFLPFYIKKDFDGLIEAGTPIFQVMPFKREPWICNEDKDLILRSDIKDKKRKRKFIGYYKNNYWKKKDFS